MTSQQPPAKASAAYQLHPEVVWIPRPDGSARLMHMSANVCAIDAGSVQLLKSIFDLGPDGAADALAREDQIEREEARGEVEDFITSLRRQKLIQAVDARTSPVDHLRDAAARGVIGPTIRLADRPSSPLRGRIRRLFWAAKWTIALFGWARAIREWERVYPQPAGGRQATVEELDTIDHAVRQVASRSLIGVECKERSLVCLALTRRGGIPSQLIVGVAHNPMQGHVWVEAQGRVISDDPDHFRAFEPVARYG
jgi:hypothetical protein